MKGSVRATPSRAECSIDLPGDDRTRGLRRRAARRDRLALHLPYPSASRGLVRRAPRVHGKAATRFAIKVMPADPCGSARRHHCSRHRKFSVVQNRAVPKIEPRLNRPCPNTARAGRSQLIGHHLGGRAVSEACGLGRHGYPRTRGRRRTRQGRGLTQPENRR